MTINANGAAHRLRAGLELSLALSFCCSWLRLWLENNNSVTFSCTETVFCTLVWSKHQLALPYAVLSWRLSYKIAHQPLWNTLITKKTQFLPSPLSSFHNFGIWVPLNILTASVVQMCPTFSCLPFYFALHRRAPFVLVREKLDAWHISCSDLLVHWSFSFAHISTIRWQPLVSQKKTTHILIGIFILWYDVGVRVIFKSWTK